MNHKRTSTALDRYVSERGVSDIVTAVKADCQRLIAGQSLPPVQLETPLILEQQRIKAVRRIKLPVDGRVFWEKDGYVIEINSGAYPARQNFTLAHEIAHTLFLPYEDYPHASSKQREAASQDDGGRREEWLCNMAAGQLLMPEPLLHPRVRAWGLSVSVLRKVAYEFGVSLPVAAIRVAETSPWPVCIAGWQNDQDVDGEILVNWSYASENAGIFLLRGATARDTSLLDQAKSGKRSASGYTDLGFMKALRTPLQKRFYTEAFTYTFGRTEQIVTVTIFDRSAEIIANLLDHARDAQEFERSGASRQLGFPWYREMRQLVFSFPLVPSPPLVVPERCRSYSPAATQDLSSDQLTFLGTTASRQLELPL